MKGGDKIAAALGRIAKNLGTAGKVGIGFYADKTYPDGTLVPMVAALNEFGSGKTPARPFFRGMVRDKSKEWPPAVATLLKANDYDAAKTLGQVGEAVSGQLRQAIVDFNGVPLSPKTIKRKGFDKQLIDTGVMLDSIDHKVE